MELPGERSWLVFADGSGAGDRLASRLRATGARCRVAHRGSDFAADGMDAFTLRAEAPEDWKQLLEAVRRGRAAATFGLFVDFGRAG